MQNFRNILFVSRGAEDETEALKQAISIAHSNKATLKALIIYPSFSEEFAEYKVRYETFLSEQMQMSIRAARDALTITEADLPIETAIESDNTPATRIIRHVLINSYDLIVKQTDPQESGKGFRAIDMELLRKCPSPVLLCRPTVRQNMDGHIAVAIDPEFSTQQTHDLSLQLLKISHSLAERCNGQLTIISCRDFEFEESFRHNPWAKVSEDTIQRTIAVVESKNRTALDNLIKESGIDGKAQVQYIKGRPDKVIPQYAEAAHIDILVMGTLARTGIPGFLIGNTSENIVQQLKCSLLALKPNGFVSPVKAY